MRVSPTSILILASPFLLSPTVGEGQETVSVSTPGGSPGAFLGDLTWVEAEELFSRLPTVILPVGAGAKEHGPHLPLNADAVVLEYLCRRAVDSLPVIVAPPILHGWFPAFRAFPGTEVADPSAFEAYVLEVARSLVKSGARSLVILNTGISRATGLPLGVVAREIRVQEGIPTLLVSWDDLAPPEMEALAEQEFGGHADEIETSIHLYLQPELVHMDRAAPGLDTRGRSPGPGYRPGYLSRDPEDPGFQPTGVNGDPTLATVGKGQSALALLTREWLKALRSFQGDSR
jgi:creatinine amidohydrolase